MSRIQEILSKAERDGTARRTRSLPDDGPQAPVGSATLPPPPRPRRVGADPDEPIGVRAQPSWTPPAAAAAPSIAETAPEAAADTPLAELDVHLVAAVAPASLAAEQYRSLRTRIKRAENGRGLRTIVITSPAKGDGKSLTAANLALTMAQEFQHRVLLLDADLRRPSIHRLFGIAESPGLSDVLMGVSELDQALVTLPDHHLTILPSGPPPGHPAELLGSAAMRRVLDTLRTRFDRILIDMPPVAPLADLHIMAPMVDGLLMIVRAGITPKPAIERALAGLDVTKVLGLVLNETGEAGTGDSYDGYGYGYGYLAG